MRLFYLFIVAVAVVFVGCSDDWKAKVESDTSWSGSFSGRTVDGTGNQTVDLDDDEVVCCVVQKQTERGRLKVSIVNEGSNPFASDGESKETTAAYGVVSVCNKK
ncbi:MAG: hypothetical protein HBSIN02_25420 [Bacteroidia bacterium]|nr:MAG: hypothetical protein HBSIN02_25420 [Bacteroidia bacterium]